MINLDSRCIVGLTYTKLCYTLKVLTVDRRFKIKFSPLWLWELLKPNDRKYLPFLLLRHKMHGWQNLWDYKLWVWWFQRRFFKVFPHFKSIEDYDRHQEHGWQDLLRWLQSKKKKGKDQESIQSSTTPDPGYQWESHNFSIRHHKLDTRGQPFLSRSSDHKASINIRARKHNKNKTKITKDPRHKSISCGSRHFREEDFWSFSHYTSIYVGVPIQTAPKNTYILSPSIPDDALYVIWLKLVRW